MTSELNRWQKIDANTPTCGIDFYGTRDGVPQRFTNARYTEDVVFSEFTGTSSWTHDKRDVYGKFVYTHWMYIPNPPKELKG